MEQNGLLEAALHDQEKDMQAMEAEREEMEHALADKDDEIERLRNSAENSEHQRADVQNRYDSLLEKIRNLEEDHILVPKANARASMRLTRGGSLRDLNTRPSTTDAPSSEADERLRLENVQLRREIQKYHDTLGKQNKVTEEIRGERS